MVQPGAPTGQFPAVAGSYPSGQYPTVQPGYRPGPPSGQYPVVPTAPVSAPRLPPDPAKAARRRQRLKRMLLVAGSVIAIVLVVVAVAGYVYYDRATQPDRSAPDVAVDNYLREYLVHRDDAKARIYTCHKPDLGSVVDFRNTIDSLERQFGVAASVSWGALTVTKVDGREHVAAVLTLDVPEANGSTSESRSNWDFLTVSESGWRVCGASRQP